VAGGGARWGGGLDNRSRWPARCFDGYLLQTVAQRPAWRGSEAHERGAGWSVLWRLEQWSAAMREQRRMARAEQSGRRSAAITGRGETPSPMVGSTDARWRQQPRSWLEALHTGWRLHAWRVEAGRQVARVGAAAGAVRTQRWRSASARGRNGAQACTCKPVTGWAGLVYAGVALGQF
jgi:hypothetical protein